MSRGTTLAQLLVMVKAEIGDNATGSTVRDTELTSLLSNKQKTLCSTYDFPFMEHRWDLTCAAGSRFLTIPTTSSATGDLGATVGINFERPVEVSVKFNQVWLPCYKGIGLNELTVTDSDTDERLDPIQRWQMATNTSEAASADKIEVWPIPASEQVIRFVGQRSPLTLASSNDKADLDDMLLVLFVAGEKLLRQENMEEAKYKLGMANQRLQQIRANYPQREERRILGAGGDGFWREDRRILPITILAG